MTNDTIDRILDDATMPPAEYCFKHGLLADGRHDWEEVVSAFAVHLIGRTEAVMRHRWVSESVSGEGFRLGEQVMRANGRVGTVIGLAWGKDGRACLVLSMHGNAWKTYLCPIKEARHLKVPSPAEVRHLLEQAIEDAADHKGDYRNTEAIADYILDMAHACFTNKEFPVGDAQ